MSSQSFVEIRAINLSHGQVVVDRVYDSVTRKHTYDVMIVDGEGLIKRRVEMGMEKKSHALIVADAIRLDDLARQRRYAPA